MPVSYFPKTYCFDHDDFKLDKQMQVPQITRKTVNIIYLDIFRRSLFGALFHLPLEHAYCTKGAAVSEKVAFLNRIKRGNTFTKKIGMCVSIQRLVQA